jgi:three-Cys-motif partner protein
MAAPKTTIWSAEPHTLAKHAILRGYLEAWFPILGRYQGRIVYYDGFAGPGRYQAGEIGSPLVALDVAVRHRQRLTCEIAFIFVEEDPRRAEWLRREELPKLELPANFKPYVLNERFEDALCSTLDDLDSRGLRIAPTFAFIDPFGVKGLPFDLIERLLRKQSCEVLVTFMTRDVNRFVSELPSHVADLIGDPSAPEAILKAQVEGEGASEARRRYESSLRRAAKFVRSFRMKDEDNSLVYDLFFATNHPLGHERMKKAMWKVDGSGSFSFSDGLDPDQIVLFTPTPGADLAPRLWNRFRGQELDVAELFASAQSTVYLEEHVRSALRLLEDKQVPGVGHIQVAPLKRDGGGRRPHKFPEGTVVRFSD